MMAVLRMRKDSKLPYSYGRRVAGKLWRFKQGVAEDLPDDVAAKVKDMTLVRGRLEIPLFGDPATDKIQRRPTAQDKFAELAGTVVELRAQVAQLHGSRPSASTDDAEV